MTMHDSRKVFLIPGDQAPLCFMGSYDPDDKPKDFIEFKTFDKNLEVGDMVIVATNTRHGYTAARVEELDVEPNLDSDVKMEWAVCPFDTSQHKGVIGKEQEFIKLANRGALKRKREEMQKDVMGGLDTSDIILIERARNDEEPE